MFCVWFHLFTCNSSLISIWCDNICGEGVHYLGVIFVTAGLPVRPILSTRSKCGITALPAMKYFLVSTSTVAALEIC